MQGGPVLSPLTRAGWRGAALEGGLPGAPLPHRIPHGGLPGPGHPLFPEDPPRTCTRHRPVKTSRDDESVYRSLAVLPVLGTLGAGRTGGHCAGDSADDRTQPVYENESALNLYETCKVRTVKAGTLEKLVEHLVPAFQGSDLSYVTIFLCTYRAFTTTQRVLDLLFQRYGRCDALTASSRYGCILPYSSVDGGPQDQLKNAVSSILGTWLDQYSEDFCQPPDFPCLKQLAAYVQLNMPGSDLERRARLLLAQLEHTELTKAEPEGTFGRQAR
ncbi:ral guanine nucleotide dissociation stimulator-like isoform X2 [Balaenoptera musculus]|uniref:Ral guanine nucleotide dissociation stimulator-like isoform X2 n=1 Tax=Balaenoptera musculus TaxID=9771 RepID=A0A8B8XLY0_BALMU|nr:ral guanine nucleotide dissociation stimulator-like isoform X2 [Balaenoptera musculus]